MIARICDRIERLLTGSFLVGDLVVYRSLSREHGEVLEVTTTGERLFSREYVRVQALNAGWWVAASHLKLYLPRRPK